MSSFFGKLKSGTVSTTLDSTAKTAFLNPPLQNDDLVFEPSNRCCARPEAETDTI
jgi:hypothetical protein